MIDIYICEDNAEQLCMFEKYAASTIAFEALDMRIVRSTSDPHLILKDIASAENIGAFFLDIDLKSDMTGMILAQQIRQLQPRCFIIFITAHSEMSSLTFRYKVEALDFIVKDSVDTIKKGIRECLLNIQEKHHSMNNITKPFIIRYPDKHIAIDYDDILFFETSGNIHKILLHMSHTIMEFTGQLKEIEMQLDDRFCRCHRSYIINRDHIAEIDLNNLVIHMKNGETCLISVRSKKLFKNIM